MNGVTQIAEQRVVRSKEERKAEIEKKIQFHKDCIKTLEQKIHDIDNPKTPTRSKGMRRILTEGKLTDDEAAKADALTTWPYPCMAR